MTFTQILFIGLAYTGAGTVIYGFFSFILWIKGLAQERKLYDEEQIELIVQKAKLQIIKELEENKKKDE